MRLPTPHPSPKRASYRREGSAHPQKQASPCSAQTILRTLGPHDRARGLAMGRFRELGGDLDRWSLQATRAAMVEALTAAEDVIELDGGGRLRAFDSPDRAALRDVRRRLESEVHP